MADKKKIIPHFNYKKCLACGICVQACPVSALELSKTDVDKYKKAYPILTSNCIGCKMCEKDCPFNAVKVY